MASKTKDIAVSASALTRYLSCPRKYWLSTQYQPRHVPIWMELGTLVHKILETGEIPPEPSSLAAKALKIAQRINEFLQTNGYELHASEIRQKFLLLPGIKLIRVLDALGYHKGEPIMVDFKVPEYPWETIPTEDGPVAPKANSLQAQAYTIFTKQDIIPTWPEKLHFVVAPSGGKSVEAFEYVYSKEGQEEFEEAARLFKAGVSKGYFPANRGYLCRNCEFAAACYESPGWRRQYEERT